MVKVITGIFLLSYLALSLAMFLHIIPDDGFEFLQHPQSASWLLSIFITLLPLAIWLMIEFLRTHSSFMSTKERFSSMLVSNQQVKKINSEKSIFLATISHEIRNPLQAILGTHELLLNEHFLKKESKRMVQNAHQTTRSLLEILNQVIDLSKMEAGKFYTQLEAVDLDHLVQNTVSSFQALSNSNSIELKVSIDPNLAPSLLLDATKLKQVLTNLLSNAIKFTAQGSIYISVQVLSDTHADQSIQFQVIDTGCGIDSIDLERIMEPFERSERVNHEFIPGSGLGLSIVKQLLMSMNSFLNIESNRHLGTSASFRILCKRSANPPIKNSLFRTKISHTNLVEIFSGKKVLIVDDYPACQEIIDQQCRYLGFNSILASNANTAIEILKKESIDLLITDEFMPEMNGSQLSKIAKQHQWNLKIVILTGDQSYSPDDSIDAYLIKPISIGELSQTLDQVLSNEISWSFKALLSFTHGNSEDAKMILQSILDTQQEIQGQLLLADADENWENLPHLNHKILSGAKLIGAKKLIYICQTIRHEDIESIKHHTKTLTKALTHLNQEISHFLQKNKKIIR
jgi:two-component system sensor histidine kinase EvgS